MAKDVRIQLTAAQKAKIKSATGKEMAEIRVARLGRNLGVSPATGLSAKDMSIPPCTTRRRLACFASARKPNCQRSPCSQR